MRDAESQLISGYFDDVLTSEQHEELSAWIRASAENARTFAAASVLHDRLRNELMIATEHKKIIAQVDTADGGMRRVDKGLAEVHFDGRPSSSTGSSRRSLITLCSTAGLICLAVTLFFKSFGDSSVLAAAGELQRLIDLNARTMDRTYHITVEETALPRRGQRGASSDDGRPPKAPMDGATLYVRDGQQFVLSRITDTGPFVTGCNGKVSWAVRPEGRVRYSKDLSRFDRDLPGHEHEMPLVNIHDGLERVRQSYEVQLLPVEDIENAVPATRLLVAVRHPKERGPRRVEISYEVESGLIRQMRFVEMPYGPESLTLRLTLQSEEPLKSDFFDHESHHDASRRVEEE